MAGELITIKKIFCSMKNEEQSLPNIGLCVLMDLIGMSSYLIPGIAEFSDIVWAPISAFVFNKLFGGRLGAIGSALNFLEEILPFTDIIPSFTIAWFIRKNSLGHKRQLTVVR